MRTITIALLAASLCATAACSVDLGSRERAPAPAYDVDEMHRMHEGYREATWCCGACDAVSDEVARCDECRRDRPAACRASETALACRSNYTEAGPGSASEVTCF
jgi:hypothetical protein